jgi:hypothetical protein
MRVEIDEPRRYQAAGGIDCARRVAFGDCRLDRGDLAEADADVADAIEGLAGVDDTAVLDHEIESSAGLGRGRRFGQGRSSISIGGHVDREQRAVLLGCRRWRRRRRCRWAPCGRS